MLCFYLSACVTSLAKRSLLRIALALTVVSVASASRAARAQTGPFPPQFGAYFWRGPESGSGDGDAGDWQNWYGRYIIHAGSPPTYETLAPQDGDSLILSHTLSVPVDVHHSVSLPGLNLPTSGLSIAYDAAFGGGSLSLAGVSIVNRGGNPYVAFPMEFVGTQFNVDTFWSTASTHTVLYDVVNIAATDAILYGYSDGNTKFLGSELHTSVLNVNGTGHTVTLEDSTLESLGVTLGASSPAFESYPELPPVDVVFTGGTTATIDQFLVIGDVGKGRLTLKGNSQVDAANAYVNVGDGAFGDLYVTAASTLTSDQLNVGMTPDGEGNVAIDHNARVFNQTGLVGALSDAQGTVNIESGGEWRVHDLNVGERGTGYIYVRNDSTLRIDGNGVLGNLAGSRGVLNLIGSTAYLMTNGQFLIGDRGAGELHLSEGATYTSQGATTLGDLTGSSGTVTIDGENGPSKWTVTGKLTIGHGSTGRVEVTHGGSLHAEGAEILLGENAGSNGTLVISGEGSTIESSGGFVVGDSGTGTMRVDNGAQYTAKEITVANENNSTGTLELAGGGSSQTKLIVSDNLTVGRFGHGTLTVDGGSRLETNGEAAIAAMANKSATAKVSGGSTWIVPQSATLRVGREGDGTLDVEGGSELKINGTVNLADTGGASQGEVNIKGSSLKLEAGSLVVGKAGTGSLSLDTGSTATSQAAATMIVGSEANSHGTLTIKAGSRFTSRGDLFVGKSNGSTGTVVLETAGILDLHLPAAHTDEHGLILGYDQGSTGTLDIRSTAVDGSLVTPAGFMVVGRGGKGTMNVRGGALSGDSTNYALGVLATGDGTLDISGDGVGIDGRRAVVGDQGKGSLKVQNKAHFNVQSLDVGTQGTVLVSGDAHLRLAGGDAVVRNEVTVQSGGSIELAGGDFLASGSASQTVTGESAQSQSPSTIKARNIRVGSAAPGQLVVDAGAMVEADNEISVQALHSLLTIGGSGTQASRATASKFTIGADGSESGVSVESGGLLETHASTAGLVQLGPQALFGVDAGFAKIYGLLQSSGRVSLINDGRIAADRVLITSGGTVNLTGGTMVVGGNLDDDPALPNNTLLVRANGRMQVNVVTALVSNPTIKGKIINGGTFIVGQSPGNLVVDGDFEMQSTGILEMEIGGLTPGAQFDQIIATGAITLGGTLDIDMVNVAGGFTLPTVGQQFTMFNAQGGVTGAFANAARLNSISQGWRVDWSLGSSSTAATITTQSVRLQADFDASGLVNDADLALWRDNAGVLANALHSQGDADGDLDVDGADFLVWQRQLGMSAAVLAATQPVPEPATTTLAATLALLAAAVVPRQRRDANVRGD